MTKIPHFIWRYLVSSNILRFRDIFAAFSAYMNLNLFGSIFVKNDKAAEFILKKIKCQLSWLFSFFWQKLDQTQ